MILLMAKFALVGSSFVERLRRFTSEDLKVPGEVKWFGFPGLRTYSLSEEMWSNIITYNPDCVFLHVGGNDITTSTRPKDVVGRIIAICERLKDSGVKSVFVAEVLTRGNFQRSPDRHLNKLIFDKKRKKINSLLKTSFGHHFVAFKDISFPKDFDDDLVHLGTKTTQRSSGMTRYFHRVRRVFVSFRHQ